MFWTRLGTPTKRHTSGSVEEIARLHQKDSKVMVYFCDARAPRSALKGDQFKKLQELRKRYEKEGRTRMKTSLLIAAGIFAVTMPAVAQTDITDKMPRVEHGQITNTLPPPQPLLVSDEGRAQRSSQRRDRTAAVVSILAVPRARPGPRAWRTRHRTTRTASRGKGQPRAGPASDRPDDSARTG
jgi:hypothetical protein